MNRKKYFKYILVFFIITSALLPTIPSFAGKEEPVVNAPVALLMDSRYW